MSFHFLASDFENIYFTISKFKIYIQYLKSQEKRETFFIDKSFFM